MRMILKDDLFKDPGLKLLKLLSLGLDGQHSMILEDEKGAHFVSWLAACPTNQLKWDVLEVVRIGKAKATLKSQEILVDVQNLDDCLKILQGPFSILLENDMTDRDFFLAMARFDQHTALKRAAENRWLQWENGGGLENLNKKRKDWENTNKPYNRIFIIFDSDSKISGQRGWRAQAVVQD